VPWIVTRFGFRRLALDVEARDIVDIYSRQQGYAKLEER
jgi:hypothetical protein